MKNPTRVFVAAMALAFASPAIAEESGGGGSSRSSGGKRGGLFHGGFYLGTWTSKFTQEGNGHRTGLTSEFAPMFQFSLGLNISRLFLEYTPTYGLAYFDLRGLAEGRQEADDVSTWSLLAANLGFRMPGLPLRPYVGYGKQHYDFTYGSDINFTGKFVRGGLGIDLHSGGKGHFELKVEYQRIYLNRSGAGGMPKGFDTEANVWTILLGARGGV